MGKLILFFHSEGLMIVGALILCSVVLNLVLGLGLMGKNPGNDYVFTGEYNGGEQYPCYLSTGEYEIWYLDDDNPNTIGADQQP